MENKEYVSYEMFGAKGDGTTDDSLAIQKAHEYANEHGLKVKTNPLATYYIGPETHTAIIMTDVDFGTSKFIIDDSQVPIEKRFDPVFKVVSAKKAYSIEIKSLKKNQMKLDMEFPERSYVIVSNSNKKQFIRKGANQNSGSDQFDSFIVDSTGYILNPVIWDFETVTSAIVYPIDETTLTISGGIFTVIANRAESHYNYYGRNIVVSRSNTVIEKITMYTAGELDHGAPYSSFISVCRAVNFTLKDAYLTPRKTYVTIGSAGVPVKMGSYSFNGSGSIGINLINVKQKNIMDDKYWGIMGTNHCKDITLDGCYLSRFDSHENVTNLTVKNSIIGYMGLSVLGHGNLVVENLTIYNNYFVMVRGDYGSRWDGDAYFKNIRWYPTNDKPAFINMYSLQGEHDFGYRCMFPHNITIENLYICDNDAKPGYVGAAMFNMWRGAYNSFEKLDFNDKDCYFPHFFSENVILKNIKTDSGLGFKLFNDTETKQCFCLEKHSVKDGKIEPNFRAYFENVDMPKESMIPDTELKAEDYGENYHLVPRLEFKNCKGGIIGDTNTPSVVKLTDCQDFSLGKNVKVEK